MNHDNDRFELQDTLYEFPYHYLPVLEQGTSIRLHRPWAAGLGYMTYMSFAVDIIEQNNPKSLLDVGCGDGRLTQMIKHSIPLVCGVDLSERAIAFARAFNPEVEYICGDVAMLSDEFDVVTVIEVLEHIPDDILPGFVRSLSERTRSNGFLLVSVPTVNVPVMAKHYRHYSLESLSSCLEVDFEIESYWWLHKKNSVEKLLRKLLHNSVFSLNQPAARSAIWRVHRRLTFLADSSSGWHLVCTARPKRADPS